MPLTDLSFLDQGRPWPPPSERERMERYDAHKKLYETHQDKVSEEWVKRLWRFEDAAAMLIVLDWPRLIANTWAMLLWSEPPKLTAAEAGTQKYLDDMTKRTRLAYRGLQAAIDQSRFGDGLLKVWRPEGKPARLTAQSPLTWFPVVALDDPDTYTAHVLAYIVEKETPKGTLRYIKAEIHTPKQIEHRLIPLSETRKLGAKVPLATLPEFARYPEKESNDLDGMTVVPVPNLKPSDWTTGMDDYDGVEGVVQEACVRLSQISRILDRHADPNMYGPPGQGEEYLDETTGQSRDAVAIGSRYFSVEAGEVIPGYATWDGRLESAFKLFETCLEQFYMTSHLSPALFGMMKAGLAESASALKRLLQGTIAMARLKAEQFEPAVREAVHLISVLDAKPIDRDAFGIEWNDGLPQDDTEVANTQAQRRTAGVLSVRRALREQGLDGDALEDEISELEEEAEAKKVPDPTAPVLIGGKQFKPGQANGEGAQGDESTSPDGKQTPAKEGAQRAAQNGAGATK